MTTRVSDAPPCTHSAELVARLRKENSELRGQVDTGTVMRVEELVNELEDATALRDSFEKVRG